MHEVLRCIRCRVKLVPFLSWVLCAVVWLVLVCALRGKEGVMLRARRAEDAEEKTSDERRAVRHSRRSFRSARGVCCEECGEVLSPVHAFALYGCWCVRCWQGVVLVVG